MKKILASSFVFSMLLSCNTPTENTSDNTASSTPTTDNAIVAPIQTREYKGGWAGIKYSVTFDVNIFTEDKSSGNYHDFLLKSDGKTHGYISISTVKMDSANQPTHELINNNHRNIKGKILGEVQTEVAAEKIGENEVYLFQDKAISGFGQDAIILCKGEAIQVKFQAQGPEESAIEKDKEAFRTFLGSVQVLDGKL